MKLYLPVKPFFITQPFGNRDAKYSGIGLEGHNGIDFMAVHGTPIYASHDGIALYEVDGGGGHGVVIRNEEEGYKTIYWHMVDSDKEPKFRSPIEGHPNGVAVKTGDLIGYADNTGMSTGDHLHFGMKMIAKGEAPGMWFNLSQNNGYAGAIDPMPHLLAGSFAEDKGVIGKVSDTLVQKLPPVEAAGFLAKFIKLFFK